MVWDALLEADPMVGGSGFFAKVPPTCINLIPAILG
jgi:hypothetical protein